MFSREVGRAVPSGGPSEKGLFPFFFERRVQLSLFFFIPVFLILFALGPTYIAVSLLSRNLNPSGINLVFIISGLVALASGLAIAYALVRPVKHLQNAIRGVATGDFRADLRLDASGEFVYLGKEFNQMVSRLAMQERLQRTERLAALGTLAAGVAHEIRNPLSSVKGLAQLLQESNISPGDRKYAERIVGEVNRLNAVVERLLNLARPSSGKPGPVDLNRMIHDVVELSGYERNQKRITILEEFDERVPEIRMDGEGMLQAVLNLLLNAIQAIPEAGTIRVRTALEGGPGPSSGSREGSVLIEVANTNSNIPKEDYRRIFDPFYTTKEGGTGLGLAITHQVVARQGGTIEVNSRNGETVFAIRLPMK